MESEDEQDTPDAASHEDANDEFTEMFPHEDHPGDEFQFDFQDAEALCNGPCEDEAAGDPYLLNLARTMYISDLLHVIHNCTEGLQAVLQYWKEYIVFLREVAALVSRKRSKVRLIRTCFQREPWSSFIHKIKEASFRVYEGRWGAVLHSVSCMLELEDCLVMGGAWDCNMFAAGADQDAGPGPGSGYTVSTKTVDEALRTSLYWGYSHMLDIVSFALLHLSSWAESCRCHSERIDLQAFTKNQRRRYIRQRINKKVLPECESKRTMGGCWRNHEAVGSPLFSELHGSTGRDCSLSIDSCRSELALERLLCCKITYLLRHED